MSHLIMSLVCGLSTVVLAGGAGALLWAYAAASARLWRRVRAAPLRYCSQLAYGAAPTVAKVAGRAVEGPDGALRAPVTETPCVWYWIRVWRVNDSVPDAKPHVIYNDCSKVPFGVADDTGQLLVILPDEKPRFLRPDYAAYSQHLVKTATQRVSNDNDTDLYGVPLDPSDCRYDADRRYEEWVVPTGSTLTAMGTVDRDAQGRVVMRDGDGQELVLFPGTEDMLGRAVRRDNRNSRAVAVMLLLFALVVLIAVVVQPFRS